MLDKTYPIGDVTLSEATRTIFGNNLHKDPEAAVRGTQSVLAATEMHNFFCHNDDTVNGIFILH